ncbi:MAG: hypothetical protein A4E31_00875 [Methanomassiliicoccales archaeon PtaU1.Bin030]|nr:MAG: hypothetical protein A4E31_00875 [Methanomassiliicoccales archaeon PtaU1.Bin030]
MAMATSWLASTDSGLSRTRRSSSSPAIARRAMTRLSATSSGLEATIAPSERSPTECPALPMRCTRRETWRGELYWMAKSTEPISIPSSREEVQMRPLRRSFLKSSSISIRTSLDSEPWCTPTLNSSSQMR